MAKDNISTVEGFLAAIAKGDIRTVLSYLDDTTVLDHAQGMPYSGTYLGREGFSDVLRRFAALGLHLVIDSVELLDAGERIVSRMELTFGRKGTDNRLASRVVEVYDVEDGIIKRIDVYYKDPAGITALAG